jgi:DNA-directed RNA polymerase subunit RPC12/RpoP
VFLGRRYDLSVKSPPIQCPRCEAPHPFRPQWRVLEDQRIEVFVRCTTCNHKVVLRVSTREIERLRKLELAWEARARAVQAKHGVPSALAQAQLRRIKKLIREYEDELENDQLDESAT